MASSKDKLVKQPTLAEKRALLAHFPTTDAQRRARRRNWSTPLLPLLLLRGALANLRNILRQSELLPGDVP